VVNNIIANNVAGWDGGGISMQDALKVSIINNTVVSNDTTASAGVLFNTLGAPGAAVPPPGCEPTSDPTQPQNPNCANPVPTSTNQAAGLVTMAHTPNLVAALPTPADGGVNCPLLATVLGATYDAVHDGNCRQISLPVLWNNIFWQNRAFHVEVAPVVTGSQQAVTTLVPSLASQTTTGQCMGGASYWDIGVRGDTGPTTHESGFTMSPGYSILSSGNYSGNGNSGANPQVVSQYCNGARIPPEACNAANIDPNDPFGALRCKGFDAPPGRSETTGTYPVFSLNQIIVAPTVDEGNNWINLTYGPLSMTNPTQTGSQPQLGNYSLQAGSPARDQIGLLPLAELPYYLAAPNHDYFGNPRKTLSTGQVDMGAVEYPAPAGQFFRLQAGLGQGGGQGGGQGEGRGEGRGENSR
jgi:hypothetical protein